MFRQAAVWIGFNLFVLAMLALDLGVFHRRARGVTVREAVGWTLVWVALALVFNGIVYFWQGPEAAGQFLTGYLVEKSLSVDNIFVFLLLFSYFRVPAQYQHRVLFWGVFSALVMRAGMIAVGAALISRFHWVLYLFGAFLVLTGIRIAFRSEQEIHPDRNPLVRLLRRLVPCTPDYHGPRFFVRVAGRRAATPLFVALLVVELTDLVFALDSIPAIFAITRDPFIVYSSNVFAILGLRALFFALAGAMNRFHFLKYGLAAVLVFVGAKMLIADVYPIHAAIALAVVAVILSAAVTASLLWPRNAAAEGQDRGAAARRERGRMP
jgi:tellurite resistance protein TerC